MKRSVFVVLFAAGLLGILTSSCSDNSSGPIHSFDLYPKAGSFQRQDMSIVWDTTTAKKPFSVLFVCADWCGWCRLLEENTLTDSTVMGLLDSYFNASVFDGDSDSLVSYCDTMRTCSFVSRNRLHVKGYPTMIFYDSRGTEISRVVGYQGPSTFADLLWQVRIKGE